MLLWRVGYRKLSCPVQEMHSGEVRPKLLRKNRNQLLITLRPGPTLKYSALMDKASALHMMVQENWLVKLFTRGFNAHCAKEVIGFW